MRLQWLLPRQPLRVAVRLGQRQQKLFCEVQQPLAIRLPPRLQPRLLQVTLASMALGLPVLLRQLPHCTNSQCCKRAEAWRSAQRSTLQESTWSSLLDLRMGSTREVALPSMIHGFMAVLLAVTRLLSTLWLQLRQQARGTHSIRHLAGFTHGWQLRRQLLRGIPQSL